MKRILALVSALLLILSAVLPSGMTVSAAENTDVYKDGSIPIEVLHENGKVTSAMDSYVKDHQGAVSFNNGEATVTMTLTGSSMITSFTLKDTDVKIVKEEKDERTVSFKVKDLDSLLPGEVEVEVPGMYSSVHKVNLKFDTSKLEKVPAKEEEPEKEESSKPEIPEKPDDQATDNEKEDNAADTDKKPEKPSNQQQYKEGTYDLPVTVLHGTEDKASSMQRFVSDPKVNIKDKQATVTLTLSSSDMITAFSVKQNNEFKAVKIVSEDKANNTRTVSFAAENLDGIIDAKITVDTPMGVMNHDVRLKFNTTDLPKGTTGDTEPEKPDNEKPEAEKPNQEKPKGKYKDGTYKLPVNILHATEDKQSSMQNYIKDPSVTIKDGKATIELVLTSSSMITDLKVEQNGALKAVKTVKENKTANERTVSFPVSDLDKVIKGSITIDTNSPFGVMNHDIRIAFDTSKLPTTGLKPDEKPGTNPTKPSENNKPGNKEPINVKNLKDGEYTINFKVLKDGTNEKSIMEQYVDTHANLKVKDGKKYIAMTLKGSSWITGIKVDGKVPTVLSTNKAADTSVVEFPVADLNKKVNAWISVHAPEYNYKGAHDVQLAFDVNSIQYLAEGESYPTKGKVDAALAPTNDYDGPGFDRNADIDNAAQKSKTAAVINPKTVDTNTAKAIFFGLLLAGSLTFLVMKFRRKTVIE